MVSYRNRKFYRFYKINLKSNRVRITGQMNMKNQFWCSIVYLITRPIDKFSIVTLIIDWY